ASFRGDSQNHEISGSGGFSIGTDTTVLVSARYTDSSPLLIGDRDFTERARARCMENNPVVCYSSPPLGSTTNIRSANGQPLTFKTGGSVGSTITSISIGYQGISSDGGAGLIGNAERYNTDLPDTAQPEGRRRTLIQTPKIASFSGAIQ